MSLSSVPKDMRGLRACKMCSMVKTFDQFLFGGCDNCDRYLRMKGNRDRVTEVTSSNFDGLVAMMSPADSWVAKWQRLSNKYVPGCYAVSVTGELPQDIMDSLQDKGIPYQNRDNSNR
ncbi:transcription elongation factor SPT4-like [Halichondria panicea]|uniref:transcription elongation factor SPT4-like n=1 Tax=Halichondria panicea TaxID=6063 RepID=UPI00312B5074